MGYMSNMIPQHISSNDNFLLRSNPFPVNKSHVHLTHTAARVDFNDIPMRCRFSVSMELSQYLNSDKRLSIFLRFWYNWMSWTYYWTESWIPLPENVVNMSKLEQLIFVILIVISGSVFCQHLQVGRNWICLKIPPWYYSGNFTANV